MGSSGRNPREWSSCCVDLRAKKGVVAGIKVAHVWVCVCDSSPCLKRPELQALLQGEDQSPGEEFSPTGDAGQPHQEETTVFGTGATEQVTSTPLNHAMQQTEWFRAKQAILVFPRSEFIPLCRN
ncbi:unnamed protein product [Arctogadus glacialis]